MVTKIRKVLRWPAENRRLAGIAAAVLSALLYGISPTVAKLAYRGGAAMG